MTILTALGLMSGTSMDGIDVALIQTDGAEKIQTMGEMSFAYEASFSKRIENSLLLMRSVRSRQERPRDIIELERDITLRHSAAVRSFLQKYELSSSNIDVLGFHGQTVLHRPDQSMTIQLGDGMLLAKETGIKTVYDMRAADMDQRGQGAPLVPCYHKAIAGKIPDDAKIKGVAFVNIGGISNVTFIREGDDLIALDCGPGNTLIDQWISQKTGMPYDKDGAIASKGVVCENIIEHYLKHPYFKQKAPKSLDRGDFKIVKFEGQSLEDGAATLSKLTALSIVKAAENVSWLPRYWVVSGGGSKNKTIMRYLRALVEPNAIVLKAENIGLNSTFIEAQAWAYLAVRSLKKMPLTFPLTTGCIRPTTGGVIATPHD